MPCVCPPLLTCCGIAPDLVAGEDHGGSLVAEAPAQYRPGHPEQCEFSAAGAVDEARRVADGVRGFRVPNQTAA